MPAASASAANTGHRSVRRSPPIVRTFSWNAESSFTDVSYVTTCASPKEKTQPGHRGVLCWKFRKCRPSNGLRRRATLRSAPAAALFELPSFLGRKKECRLGPGREVAVEPRLFSGFSHMPEQLALPADAVGNQLGLVLKQPLAEFVAVGRQLVVRCRRFVTFRPMRPGKRRQRRRVAELPPGRVIIDPLRRQPVKVPADAKFHRRALESVAKRRL